MIAIHAGKSFHPPLIYCTVEFTDSKWRLPRAQFKRLFLYNRVIVTIVYNTKYLIGIYKHTFQILHMFIRRILKMCVINCLIVNIDISYF